MEEYSMKITGDTYLVFIKGDKIEYLHNRVNQCTEFSNDWKCEKYTTEQEMIDRLSSLGIIYDSSSV